MVLELLKQLITKLIIKDDILLNNKIYFCLFLNHKHKVNHNNFITNK